LSSIAGKRGYSVLGVYRAGLGVGFYPEVLASVLAVVRQNVFPRFHKKGYKTRVFIDLKFPFGQVAGTAALMRCCEEKNFSILSYPIRHGNCDWGDVCKDDKAANDEALKEGLCVLSEYRLPDGKRIWIITEADRNATTVLFPEDY